MQSQKMPQLVLASFLPTLQTAGRPTQHMNQPQGSSRVVPMDLRPRARGMVTPMSHLLVAGRIQWHSEARTTRQMVLQIWTGARRPAPVRCSSTRCSGTA